MTKTVTKTVIENMIKNSLDSEQDLKIIIYDITPEFEATFVRNGVMESEIDLLLKSCGSLTSSSRIRTRLKTLI